MGTESVQLKLYVVAWEATYYQLRGVYFFDAYSRQQAIQACRDKVLMEKDMAITVLSCKEVER